MQSNKNKRKIKRKLLQPCKYYEMANIDIDKMKLERYYMPIALNGPINKGKLDKKIIEIEDIGSFYLNGSRNWKEPVSSNYSHLYMSPNIDNEYDPISYDEGDHGLLNH